MGNSKIHRLPCRRWKYVNLVLKNSHLPLNMTFGEGDENLTVRVRDEHLLDLLTTYLLG